MFKSASLFNKLDENIRKETSLSKFKVGTKEWVKKNISVKPKPKHPNLTAGRIRPPRNPPDPPRQAQNNIRRYLIQLPHPSVRPPPT